MSTKADGTYEVTNYSNNLKFIDSILHQLVYIRTYNDLDGEELSHGPHKARNEWRKVPSETTS